jgi:sarcosine oxidase subunit beta
MSLSITKTVPATADLVVIGGGVVGAATAFFAARAGLRTVVIERRPALGTLSTAAATGAFRAQFDNPEEMAIVREGIALYERFAEVAGLPGFDIGLRIQGYVWVATEERAAARQREQVARQRAWGLTDVEVLSGDEARRRFPYLGPNVIQARYRAGDGWLDPRRLTHGYALASRAAFALETTALGIERRGDRVAGVTTSAGRIATDRVVVAAGAFSGVVAKWAGVELPLTLLRRHRLVIPDVPEVPANAPMTIDDELGAHWRPALGGAHVMWTQSPATPTEPLEDVPPCEDFAFDVLHPDRPNSVARICPFWRSVWERGTGAWFLRAGQYDLTPDHRPLLGATPVEGLYVNTGYSGHGVMASAGGSRLVVDVITGAQRNDHAFRLERPFEARQHDLL